MIQCSECQQDENHVVEMYIITVINPKSYICRDCLDNQNKPKYGDYVELKPMNDEQERDFLRKMNPELTEDELTQYIESVYKLFGVDPNDTRPDALDYMKRKWVTKEELIKMMKENDEK